MKFISYEIRLVANFGGCVCPVSYCDPNKLPIEQFWSLFGRAPADEEGRCRIVQVWDKATYADIRQLYQRLTGCDLSETEQDYFDLPVDPPKVRPEPDYLTADACDLARMAVGNVFRTEEEAKKEVERRKVLTELRRLARESWGGGKADWSNSLQRKWSLFLSHGEHRWRADAWRSGQLANAVYFATEQAALTAIETIGADRLMLLLED